MSYEEALLVCALFPSKEEAEAAKRLLEDAGIAGGEVHAPGPRLHGVPSTSFEVRVPQGQASRARVLLSEATNEGRLG